MSLRRHARSAKSSSESSKDRFADSRDTWGPATRRDSPPIEANRPCGGKHVRALAVPKMPEGRVTLRSCRSATAAGLLTLHQLDLDWQQTCPYTRNDTRAYLVLPAPSAGERRDLIPEFPSLLKRLSALPTITITTPTPTLALMTVPLINSIGIFGVVNQDGTVNSPTNPAPVGSAVSIYLTGLGAGPDSSPTTPNGAVSSSASDVFHDNIRVLWTNSGQPLAVLYAGTAPGSINGLDQVNVQLAANVSQNPSLTVEVVGFSTTTVVASAVFPVYTK